MIASVGGLTYTYPGAAAPALAEASVAIDAGQIVLVAGESGGGKSTLLRLFNGLVPQFYGGRYRGAVRVDGLNPATTPARRVATIAGMVFQEPETQGIADIVTDEIAFGMEQQGIPRATMLVRTASVLAELGIEHLRHRRLATLSGGERQRVAIAAVMALEPRLLLLDEPASQLDSAGAASVAAALRVLAARDVAVAVVEHRYEHFLPLASDVWVVNAGSVATIPAPRFALPADANSEEDRVPLPSPGRNLFATTGLTVTYPGHRGLDSVDLSLREGEIVALVGPNGGGKTTLLRALAGLAHLDGGEVTFDGRPAPPPVFERAALLGLVPQDPVLALYHETVRDELRESLQRRAGAPAVESALAAWDVQEFADHNPRDLSVGQQQRVAIAAMLAHDPPVWMLDEPTRGADAATQRWLAGTLRRHAASGGAAIVATHDLRWAASFATRVVGLDNGRVDFDLPSSVAFGPAGPSAIPLIAAVIA